MQDPDALRDRLDALSGRIDKRIHELKESGTFSNVHLAGMDDIRRRTAMIQDKLDAAIAKGNRWSILKRELERDFHSLREDFEQIEQRLDSRFMK